MNDDDRKQILGEALMDELKTIREYVEDIPIIKTELQQVHAKVDDLGNEIKVIKAVVSEHESDIKALKQKIA